MNLYDQTMTIYAGLAEKFNDLPLLGKWGAAAAALVAVAGATTVASSLIKRLRGKLQLDTRSKVFDGLDERQLKLVNDFGYSSEPAAIHTLHTSQGDLTVMPADRGFGFIAFAYNPAKDENVQLFSESAEALAVSLGLQSVQQNGSKLPDVYALRAHPKLHPIDDWGREPAAAASNALVALGVATENIEKVAPSNPKYILAYESALFSAVVVEKRSGLFRSEPKRYIKFFLDNERSKGTIKPQDRLFSGRKLKIPLETSEEDIDLLVQGLYMEADSVMRSGEAYKGGRTFGSWLGEAVDRVAAKIEKGAKDGTLSIRKIGLNAIVAFALPRAIGRDIGLKVEPTIAKRLGWSVDVPVDLQSFKPEVMDFFGEKFFKVSADNLRGLQPIDLRSGDVGTTLPVYSYDPVYTYFKNFSRKPFHNMVEREGEDGGYIHFRRPAGITAVTRRNDDTVYFIYNPEESVKHRAAPDDVLDLFEGGQKVIRLADNRLEAIDRALVLDDKADAVSGKITKNTMKSDQAMGAVENNWQIVRELQLDRQQVAQRSVAALAKGNQRLEQRRFAAG